MRHQKINWLYEVILGGQDGLVNVLGIVLGVTAANGSKPIIIAASLAAAFAEAISMAAVAYTSTLTQRDHYKKEWAREMDEVDTIPEQEKEELREIYRKKGFSGEILEQVVATIAADKNNWVEVMMEEELKLQPVDQKSIFRTSAVVGLAAIFGSFIPLTPYFLFDLNLAPFVAVAISGLALFLVGVYEAKIYVGLWWKNGLRMTFIGLGSALVGYLIGTIFKVPGA
ncbi:VIT1/CCC1 transporter family protein [Candidatus Gottesmanbacteria bacterium]|nr:VIT1/CCC1 transporter family protein [Candidatus Gottesmanbacteria bacterium]